MATIAQLLGVVERLSFFESAILNLFFCFILIQISHNLWDTKNFFEILMITLISSKNLGGDRNMNNTVGAWYAAQIEHTSWGFPKEIPKFESTLNPEPNKNSHWYMLL